MKVKKLHSFFPKYFHEDRKTIYEESVSLNMTSGRGKHREPLNRPGGWRHNHSRARIEREDSRHWEVGHQAMRRWEAGIGRGRQQTVRRRVAGIKRGWGASMVGGGHQAQALRGRGRALFWGTSCIVGGGSRRWDERGGRRFCGWGAADWYGGIAGIVGVG